MIMWSKEVHLAQKLAICRMFEIPPLDIWLLDAQRLWPDFKWDGLPPDAPFPLELERGARRRWRWRWVPPGER